MENIVKGNKEYKDTLFKLIFGNENHKEFTLALYNALNGTNYSNVDDIQINTLENVVYIKMKNDVSFILGSTMCLYEQQSTYNPNMAYRMLEYTVALFQNLVTSKGYNKYSSRQFKLPAPNYVVFYNGNKNIPDVSAQRLSDMYEENSDTPQLDLKVKVYNINENRNNILKNDCKPLYEYMWVVDHIKQYTSRFGYSEEMIGEAVTKVINEMPDSFSIKSLLVKEKKEVISMLFEEFNEELYRQAAMDDAKASFNDGFKKGSDRELLLTIERMVKAKLSLDTIAIATGLTTEEIEKIISTIK